MTSRTKDAVEVKGFTLTRGEKRRPMRVAGLFAGIGGLELGLSNAGHETKMLCELEPAAAAVLKHRFPDISLIPDVRDVGRLPGIDLLCAGFPCQDLSSVGQKKGIKGSQSSLVDEVFRILENNAVDWVLLENVRFMLHLRKGEAMKKIVSRLEELGYRWAYRVLNSEAFGLPHRRHRVFILASRTGDPRAVLLGQDAAQRESALVSLDQPVGFYWTEGKYAVGLTRNGVPPLKGGSTIGIPSPPAILLPNGFVGTPDLRDAERLQGFPADWTIAAEQTSKRAPRWKLVGNAVTVPVAEWIGRRLREHCEFDEAPTEVVGRSWPTAAWCMGGKRFQSAASDSPLAEVRGIDSYLKYPMKPLSVRATDGFLKRAQAGAMHFPKGFLHALQAHSEAMQ